MDEHKPHHVSDVDHWGLPDRNYYIFVFLSVLFGFLGWDHYYLRSFGTGTQKFIVNIFTLGLWYVWDIIQIVQDGEKIRSEGLSSPLDWIRGIGRGVFTPLENVNNEPVAAQKSYLIYAFLAIFFGMFGADKFYIGQGWQGLAKLFSTWNIFLFLFGLLWIAWDSYHAFFMTDSILKDGILPPLPFSLFFNTPISADIFKVQKIDSTNSGNLPVCTEGPVWCTMDWIAKTFGFPKPPQGLPLGEIYKDIVAPVISTELIKEVRALRQEMPSIPSKFEIPKLPTQVGGSITENSGPGPVIAGALTALVVVGGLKGFYDFITKQYG
jgi:TM2 domain-containing membrane protein YozV